MVIVVNGFSKWSVNDGQSKHAQPIDSDQAIVRKWLFMIQHWQWFNLLITWSLWEIKRWQWDHPPLAWAESATMHGSLSQCHDDLIDLIDVIGWLIGWWIPKSWWFLSWLCHAGGTGPASPEHLNARPARSSRRQVTRRVGTGEVTTGFHGRGDFKRQSWSVCATSMAIDNAW